MDLIQFLILLWFIQSVCSCSCGCRDQWMSTSYDFAASSLSTSVTTSIAANAGTNPLLA